jgi:hypothetical protein
MRVKYSLLGVALAMGFVFGGASVASAAEFSHRTHVRHHHHHHHHHHHCHVGRCGWAYTDGDNVYFASGNGWPFNCHTDDAEGWPYYEGVGTGRTPEGKEFGFAYSFRPYAVCRQAHGVRFCRHHWQDFSF